jgi:hypothetical protein
MDILDIVILSIVGLAFFLPGFFIEKLEPNQKLEGTQKILRILHLTAGAIMLALFWFGPLGKQGHWNVLITILVVEFVYVNVKNWRYKSKNGSPIKTDKRMERL